MHGVHQMLEQNCFGRLSCVFMTLHYEKTFSWPALKSLLLVMLKALNFFFGFPKYSSVTAMLMQLRLPSCFGTVLHNAKVSFCARLKCVKNGLFDALGLALV